MTLEERVQLALAKARHQFPPEPKVVGMEHELIIDSTGDDAVEILIKIDDATPEDQWMSAWLEPIAKTIREILRQEGIDLWPYIHFLTPSEEKEAKAEVEEAERRERARDAAGEQHR